MKYRNIIVNDENISHKYYNITNFSAPTGVTHSKKIISQHIPNHIIF